MQYLSFHDQPIPRLFLTYLRRGLEGEWRQEGEWSQEVEPNTNLTLAISQFPADMTQQMKKKETLSHHWKSDRCTLMPQDLSFQRSRKVWKRFGGESQPGCSPSIGPVLYFSGETGETPGPTHISCRMRWGGKKWGRPLPAHQILLPFLGSSVHLLYTFSERADFEPEPKRGPIWFSDSQSCHTQRKPICMASQGRPAWPLSFKATRW